MPYIEKGLKFVDDLAKKFDSLNPKQKDMIVKIGLVAAAMGPLLTGGGKVTQMFGNMMQGRSGIGGMIGQFGKAGNSFKALGASLGGGKLLAGLGAKLKGIVGIFGKIGPAAKAAFASLSGPVGIAIAVIAALIIAGILVYKNWDKIKKKAKEVFTKIKPIIMPVVNQVKAMAAGIKNAFIGIVNGVKVRVKHMKKQMAELANAAKPVFAKIKAFLSQIIAFLAKVMVKRIQVTLAILETIIKTKITQIKLIVNGIMDVLSGIISFVTNVFKGNWKAAWEDVKGIFKTIWDTFTGVIKAPLNGMIDLVNRAIGSLNRLKISIPDWVPKWGGKTWSPSIPSIPHLYTGTNNWPGGLAVINDQGGEIVDLPQGARVYPHEKSKEMMRPNINITISNMSVREEADIDRIASALYNRMELAWSNVG